MFIKYIFLEKSLNVDVLLAAESGVTSTLKHGRDKNLYILVTI